MSRLSRRIGLALFLEIWPVWAAAAVGVATLAVLACRIAIPAAAPYLRWLWLTPVIVAAPAFVMCRRRLFTTADVAALADSLAGGSGTLLAVLETDDAAWTGSPLVARAAAFRLPRLAPWRRLSGLAAALACLAVALALPQRSPRGATAPLARDIANDLTATAAELKRQQMVTPEEEKAIEDEIERIRRGAEQRVDASSWEASDALREKLAAEVAQKRDALQWARDSLARYTAAASDAADGGAGAEAQGAELMKALDKLAQNGLFAGAPDDLKATLRSRKLPADAASRRALAASLAKYLRETNGRFGELAKLGKEFGRFNPADFPVAEGESASSAMEPGSGGVDRGRGDAPLTWGKETAPFDKFKATPLPPGAARSPDDWAPVVELPGAPQVAPQQSASAGARDYAATAGEAAWRRSLAPRHQSAVKKYFAK